MESWKYCFTSGQAGFRPWQWWLPLTFCSILIFATHAHPAPLLLYCYTDCLTTDEFGHFSGRFRPLWHTCPSHHGIMPKYPTINLLFVNYLLIIYLRLTLCLCNNSKIRAFLRAKVLLICCYGKKIKNIPSGTLLTQVADNFHNRWLCDLNFTNRWLWLLFRQ